MAIQPIGTDGVAWSLGQSIGHTTLSLAKMAEPIKMPYGMWIQV